MRSLATALLIVAASAATGCEVAKRAVITPFYKPIDVPASRVIADVPYVEGPGAHPIKHKLDLFLPDTRGFTTVVFVHGGNWIQGDKSLHVAGADIYRNLGRFLARHGYGAAIVNYRLLPEVTWEAQPADLASAVKWVHANIARHGGDPNAMVLMGHSAGAQLASLVGVNPVWLSAAGVPRSAIRGVAAVSGAGYDIADERTYVLLGHSRQWYARWFHTDTSPTWVHEASPVNYLDPSDPPFLIMFSTADPAGLRHQSRLLHERLTGAGIWNWMAPISGLNHSGIIIVMSRPDRAPGPVLLRFLDQLSQHPR